MNWHFTSSVLHFLAIFFAPVLSGRRFNNNFRNNHRPYGNIHGRPNFNQFHQNERISFNNGITCPRPVFTDAYLEIENCVNSRHFACFDENQGIPTGWKGKMACQRGNRILKYASWCLDDGNWSPPFLNNCDELFELQQANGNRNVGHQGQEYEAAHTNHNNNPITSVGQHCNMLQIQLSKNFLLTCLKPGYFEESNDQCVQANTPVPSGSKVFLRCKAPFTNPTSDSEWTCVNGNWDGSRRKMVCVYEYSTNKPAHVPPPEPNYGWRNPAITEPPPRPYVPPTTRPTTTTTTTLAPYIRQPSEDNVNTNMRVMCPPLTQRSTGIQIQCIIGGSQVYGTNCEKWNVVGTEASYSCRQYYESNLSLKVLYRTCKQDGTWTGSSDSFTCVAQCGLSNTILSPRITFGAATTRNQWPWHAAIFLLDKNGEWKYVCGGTVLTSRSVITAAHCITLYQTKITRDPTEIRVEVGKFRREERDEYVQIKQVDTFDIYDSYDPFSFESDIGIIILKDEITFGYHVRPVCFPQTPDSALEEQQLAIGSMGTVVGFGYDEYGNLSDELKMASLLVVSQSDCADVNEGGSLTSLNSRSTTYCAGLKNRTNVCNGDSGGGMVFPLKSENTVRWYLHGIVSAGISNGGKCDPEKYSVFTRVGRYASWITRTLSHHDVS